MTREDAFDEAMRNAIGGSRESMYKIALMYNSGDGCQIDDGRALHWLTQAATVADEDGYELSHFKAAKLLGRRYETGLHAPKDLTKAIFYYELIVSLIVARELRCDAILEWNEEKDREALDVLPILSSIYFRNGMPEHNIERGIQILKIGFEHNHYPSRFILASRIFHSDVSPSGCKEVIQCLLNVDLSDNDLSEEDLNRNDLDDRGREILIAALMKLYGFYCEGKDIPVDERAASIYLERAANLGHSSALFEIGLRYANGIGLERNLDMALEWLHQAKNDGHPKAAKWISKIESMANADSYFEKAEAFYYGSGVEKDEPEAVFWYHKAAEMGHAEAQYSLGICYETGIGIAISPKAAANWYRKAAQQGHASAQNNLGCIYRGREGGAENKLMAFFWWRRAADQGDMWAQFNLAECYKEGDGVEKNLQKAFMWYCESAEQGLVEAEYKIGIFYKSGQVVDKNVVLAVHWFQKAAAGGLAEAQYELADCYFDGIGVEPDSSKAVHWLHKAAEKGHAAAKARIASTSSQGHAAARSDL